MRELQKYTIFIPNHEPVIIYAHYIKQLDQELMFYRYEGIWEKIATFYTNTIAGFMVDD